MSAARRTKHRPVTAPADTVDRQIAALDALDLGALRVQFRNRTGRIAPARISRALLLRVLAYRIQADAFGDLRPETRRLLDRIAAAGEAQTSGPDATASTRPAGRPRAGTVLVREWRGRMEHVMVLQDGFTWNGWIYQSLSAVALAMTGTKWNGRRFFGLDRPSRDPSGSPSGSNASKQSAQGSGFGVSKPHSLPTLPRHLVTRLRSPDPLPGHGPDRPELQRASP